MKQRADLTFKENLSRGRHGWLRLTPAYSVKIVGEILDENQDFRRVLEPFSGTATTGLVCGERGIASDGFDINPFLVWFGAVKTSNHSDESRREALALLADLPKKLQHESWVPPIFDIERWWSKSRIELLSDLHGWLISLPLGSSRDLLNVAFCRCVIDWSNAAFNHQSMSFKDAGPTLFDEHERDQLLDEYTHRARGIIESTAVPVPGQVRVLHGDSREIQAQDESYDALITSPPYPNRMSYIRELRPYMYWLGYLTHARQAGELDWQAIGGTWGIATSLVEKWRPNGVAVEHPGFDEMVGQITARSPVLANYVHKYFADMTLHIRSAAALLRPGGRAFYIVGNSKFFDTMVHVEEIYASLMRAAGFESVRIDKIRKRNSKKELFEFAVSGSNASKAAKQKEPKPELSLV